MKRFVFNHSSEYEILRNGFAITALHIATGINATNEATMNIQQNANVAYDDCQAAVKRYYSNVAKFTPYFAEKQTEYKVKLQHVCKVLVSGINSI